MQMTAKTAVQNHTAAATNVRRKSETICSNIAFSLAYVVHGPAYAVEVETFYACWTCAGKTNTGIKCHKQQDKMNCFSLQISREHWSTLPGSKKRMEITVTRQICFR